MRMSKDCNHEHSLQSTCTISSINTLLTTFMAKKKYKLVTWKVWPILDTLPSRFHIECNITGNLLTGLPTLSLHPPPFTPCGHYTEEWCAKMDDLHSSEFLWPTECNLLHHFVSIPNEGFAWDDSKCGHFCKDFFPPIEIPIVAHTPWVEWNIPILPGIYNEVCRIIHIKMDAGVYEWSNSSYHSHWFCIIKKDMRSLCLIHSLELLNAVMIQHSSVMPFTEQIAEQFAGCAVDSVPMITITWTVPWYQCGHWSVLSGATVYCPQRLAGLTVDIGMASTTPSTLYTVVCSTTAGSSR